MLMDSFFNTITQQLSDELPFVVYRKPNEVLVNGILQKDDVLHTISDYSEIGFVFAPFDTEEQAVLIPFEKSIETIFNEEISIQKQPVSSEKLDEKEAHIHLVQQGIGAINKADLSKVVLSREEKCSIKSNDPVLLFKNALALYKNAFVYLWYHPKVGCWLGATPEVLLQTRNNQFKTMALAGTQLYTENIIWKEKEQDEQQIVTDYITENLASKEFKFTEGTPYTIKAGDLAHIRTDIKGTINVTSRDTDLQTLINTLHPTPAVCGFPKDAAKDFILKNEGYDRQFYTGFLGELNIETKRKGNRRNTENHAYRFTTKSSSLFVNLRCMQLNKTLATIYVGGGITASSNAENEYEETCNKTNTMKKLINS